MKELIKEAESLYLELSRITNSLIYARSHDDNDLLHGCRNELENFAQSVMQTLKCLIDRKDNIVDLGEVWHSIDVEPQKGSWFVGQIGEKAYDTFVAEIEGERMKDWFEGCNIKRWAYIKDLLPKGGE